MATMGVSISSFIFCFSYFSSQNNLLFLFFVTKVLSSLLYIDYYPLNILFTICPDCFSTIFSWFWLLWYFMRQFHFSWTVCWKSAVNKMQHYLHIVYYCLSNFIQLRERIVKFSLEKRGKESHNMKVSLKFFVWCIVLHRIKLLRNFIHGVCKFCTNIIICLLSPLVSVGCRIHHIIYGTTWGWLERTSLVTVIII